MKLEHLILLALGVMMLIGVNWQCHNSKQFKANERLIEAKQDSIRLLHIKLDSLRENQEVLKFLVDSLRQKRYISKQKTNAQKDSVRLVPPDSRDSILRSIIRN